MNFFMTKAAGRWLRQPTTVSAVQECDATKYHKSNAARLIKLFIKLFALLAKTKKYFTLGL
jgi:hypothetical protein